MKKQISEEKSAIGKPTPAPFFEEFQQAYQQWQQQQVANAKIKESQAENQRKMQALCRLYESVKPYRKDIALSIEGGIKQLESVIIREKLRCVGYTEREIDRLIPQNPLI